ncbi:MAG: hypothetical protein DDT38_00025 [Firmicutes bacterium]|nr:hypothetical protein [candidate division NPL-UPA2 bacterium]
MRKLRIMAVVTALVLGMFSIAHGEDYRARVLEYLRAKYGSQASEITLHEGGLTRLELTGETFWMAKYLKDVRPTPPDQAVIGQEPPKGMVLHAPPDRSITSVPEIVGLVAIRVSTGEILDGAKMEAFYRAEQTAWERLAIEAGKIELSLYRKLRDLPAEVRLSVVIQPSVNINPEIRTKVAELRKKYPLVAANLTLSDEQLLRGGTIASDLPATDKAEPAIAIAPSKPEPRVPSEQDAAFRLQAEAFFTAVGQLRLEAVQESIKAIEAALAALSVKPSGEPEGHMVRAELTAEEIESLASLTEVETIFEHMTVEPAIGFGREPASSTPLKATDAVKLQSTEASVVSSVPRGYQVAGAVLMITSLFVGLYALTARQLKP